MLSKIINHFATALKNKSKPNLVENKEIYHWSREREELLAELRRSPTTRPRDTLSVIESKVSDSDFKIFNIEGILESQQEFLDRIKIAIGLSQEDFQTKLLPMIRSYAEYVYLLPATKDWSHDKAGGLFRYGVEVGFYAAQSAGGAIFPEISYEGSKSQLRLKWALATFTAGLLSEIHVPLTGMIIKNQSGDKWIFTDESLYEWLLNTKSKSYYIEWIEDNYSSDFSHESAISTIVDKIITHSSYEHLSNKTLEITGYMTSAISKPYRGSGKNPIADIVKLCGKHVKDSDLKFQHKLNYPM